MRKLAVLIPLLFLLLTAAASAETIYTDDAIEYSKALKASYSEPGASAFSVSAEDMRVRANADRTLMVFYENELNDQYALFDISDEYHIHTLVYADSAAADKAYEYYSENGYDVCRDEILDISDTYLSWGPEYIGTPDFISGLKSSYGSAPYMPKITVAVIDTGVDYKHSFLSGRINTADDYDFYNNDYDAMDDNNHGTHVAGIIADNTLSNVTILPIKVANSSGSLTTSDLKSGIQYAINSNVDIINMSLSSSTEDRYRSTKSIFASLFNRAYSNGITICVAAGNADNYGNIHNANYIFPAYMDNTIVAANLTRSGSMSGSSNYGSVIDIAAPGSGIYSTIRGNKYSSMSGTSMASPFAAAAAALLMSRNPYITPSQIESELRSNAAPFSAEYEDYYYGRYGVGVLNISNYYSDPISSASPSPASTSKPIPTPEPETPQLISNIKYENSRIYAVISNPNNILKDSAEAIAVGYINGIPKTIQSMSVATEGYETVFNGYLEDADKFDYIKLFIWNSLDEAKPLSKSYTVKIIKTGDSVYTIQTIKE